MIDNKAFVFGNHGSSPVELLGGGAKELSHVDIQVFIVGKDLLLDNLVKILHVHLDNVCLILETAVGLAN